MREAFDKVFPELKKQREDKERLLRCFVFCSFGFLVSYRRLGGVVVGASDL